MEQHLSGFHDVRTALSDEGLDAQDLLCRPPSDALKQVAVF